MKKVWWKGKKHKFESILKMRKSHFKGEEKILRKNGYIYIYSPEHPKRVNSRIPEQTLIMERAIGRFLFEDEIVHHINLIKTDNRLDNLMLMPKKQHKKLHSKINGFGTRIQSHNQRDYLTGKFLNKKIPVQGGR